MDSTTLLRMGFCEWKPFKLGVQRLAPENKGVYAFRGPANIGLTRGSSDLVYVGRAMSDRRGRYHNIRHCLNEYLHPGHSQGTRIRIRDAALAFGYEVSWMTANQPDQLECQLLRAFHKDHGQLPPENRSWPPECGPFLEES
jgi:hypothetical protein